MKIMKWEMTLMNYKQLCQQRPNQFIDVYSWKRDSTGMVIVGEQSSLFEVG